MPQSGSRRGNAEGSPAGTPMPGAAGDNARMSTWILVYAIGAAQAAVLALALWRRPQNAAANRVLACWVAVVCFDLAVKAAYLADPGPLLFRAYRLVWVFPYAYGSLFFLYVRTLVTARAPAWRDLVHLGGVAFAALASAPAWLGGGARVAADFDRYRGDDWPPPFPHYDVVLFAYALSYVGAALWQLHRHRRDLRARRADADRWSLRWVEALALTQLAIWCIALAHVVLRLRMLDYYAIYAAVAAWVCLVGYFALVQPPALPGDEADGPQAGDGKAAHAPAVATPQGEVRPVGVGRDAAGDARPPSGPDGPPAPEVAAALQRLMADEALYRAPALTIGQLARRSGYPEYLVSSIINRRFGATFWEWVNQLRVDAVRARLDDAGEARTLLEIAYDCGFTAKSTFNSAFKRRVGETPSAYRQRMRASGSGAGSGDRRAG